MLTAAAFELCVVGCACDAEDESVIFALLEVLEVLLVDVVLFSVVPGFGMTRPALVLRFGSTTVEWLAVTRWGVLLRSFPLGLSNPEAAVLVVLVIDDDVLLALVVERAVSFVEEEEATVEEEAGLTTRSLALPVCMLLPEAAALLTLVVDASNGLFRLAIIEELWL